MFLFNYHIKSNFPFSSFLDLSSTHISILSLTASLRTSCYKLYSLYPCLSPSKYAFCFPASHNMYQKQVWAMKQPPEWVIKELHLSSLLSPLPSPLHPLILSRLPTSSINLQEIMKSVVGRKDYISSSMSPGILTQWLSVCALELPFLVSNPTSAICVLCNHNLLNFTTPVSSSVNIGIKIPKGNEKSKLQLRQI